MCVIRTARSHPQDSPLNEGDSRALDMARAASSGPARIVDGVAVGQSGRTPSSVLEAYRAATTAIH